MSSLSAVLDSAQVSRVPGDLQVTVRVECDTTIGASETRRLCGATDFDSDRHWHLRHTSTVYPTIRMPIFKVRHCGEVSLMVKLESSLE